jgi:hypothetical protein
MTEMLDWRTADYVRIGERHLERGEHADAAYWFKRAVRLSPRHEASLFNLAVASIRREGAAEERASVAHEALDSLKEILPEGPEADAMRYALEFNKVLAYDLVGETSNALTGATRLAAHVVRSVESGTDAPGVARLEGPATSLLASVVPADRPASKKDRPSRARLADMLEQGMPITDVAAACERFALDVHRKDPRTQYNLARADVRRGEANHDAAMAHLRKLVNEPVLMTAARNDPTMAPLAEERPEEFEALVASSTSEEHTPVGPQTPLTRPKRVLRRPAAPSPAVGTTLVVLAAVLVDLVTDWPPGWLWLAVAAAASAALLRVAWRHHALRRPPREPPAADTQAWEGARAVAFERLASALGEVIDGLAWPLTGTPRTFRQRALGRRRPDWEQIDERLSKRLDAPYGPALAIDVLDAIRSRLGERLSESAGPMLRAPELAAVLKRAVSVEDDIVRIQDALRETDVEQARDEWGAAMAQAVSLRDDLLRAAGVEPAGLSEGWLTAPVAYRDRLAERAAEPERTPELLARRLEHPGKPQPPADA